MHSLSPVGTDPADSDRSADGGRTSLVLVPLWFLLAGAVGFVLWHTGRAAFFVVLIHADSSVGIAVATLVSGTVLLAWLVPVALTHLVLVCRRRRSSLRTALAAAQGVLLLLSGVWLLLPSLLGPE